MNKSRLHDCLKYANITMIYWWVLYNYGLLRIKTRS